MSARPWIACLLLLNYLLVVGLGCVTRPGDTAELIQIQTQHQGSPGQQCRYMRMDGLEAFMAEAMASRYQNAPMTPPHHLISVVSGITTHDLPAVLTWHLLPIAHALVTPVFTYVGTLSPGIRPTISTPPWQA